MDRLVVLVLLVNLFVVFLLLIAKFLPAAHLVFVYLEPLPLLAWVNLRMAGLLHLIAVVLLMVKHMLSPLRALEILSVAVTPLVPKVMVLLLTIVMFKLVLPQVVNVTSLVLKKLFLVALVLSQ